MLIRSRDDHPRSFHRKRFRKGVFDLDSAKLQRIRQRKVPVLAFVFSIWTECREAAHKPKDWRQKTSGGKAR